MIINRSFLTEVAKTAVAVTIVVICIFLVLRGIIFLGQAADGLIPVSAVFSLVSLAMIANLDIILPLMVYIALIMVFNQWYADRQMVVLSSCGAGVLQFIRPLIVLNLFVVSIVTLMSLYLTPLTLTKGYALEAQYRQSNEVNGIVTGQFVEAKNGQATYFVEDYDRKTGLYNNIFAYQGSFGREGVVVSDTAYRTTDEKTQDNFLVLNNGSRYEGTPGMPDYRIVDFERYAIRIENPSVRQLYLPIKARTTMELIGNDSPGYYGELVWRIAKIMIFPILSIFALALTHVDYRTGKAHGAAFALLVYLTYNNFLGYAATLVKKEVVTSSSWPVWLVHTLYALLACYCLYRRNYNLPLIPGISAWRKRWASRNDRRSAVGLASI